MQIVEIKISELKPSEYNPRACTEKEAADLSESIDRFGIVEPIVCNEAPGRENVIIGGHQRFFICQKRGRETMPVVYVNIPDIKKEQELNLRLNKNLGHWDWGMLANFDEAMLKGVGFEDIELDKGFDLDFQADYLEFDYPFGTINSFVRVGDLACEIPDNKYLILKRKIEERGGLNNFIESICLGQTF